MKRYILTNMDTGAVLGQKLNSGGVRPFVSIAEAYELLARMELENSENAGEPGLRRAEAGSATQAGSTFNAWALCEIYPVERP